MTDDEAKLIAKLIGFADRGCSNCVGDLVDHANRLFPQFYWKKPYPNINLVDTYRNEYDHYLQVNVERRP